MQKELHGHFLQLRLGYLHRLVNLKYFYNHIQTAKNEEKRMAQIDSAKRSLVTNLICMSVFLFGILIGLQPAHKSNYFIGIFFSFVKSLMPVLSTVANFGTVRLVYLQYKEHFWP